MLFNKEYGGRLQENTMEITFWGTRGSIASPGPDTIVYGGNTTCLELITGTGETVVIDAGTGIRRLGDALMQRSGPVEIFLLMTHIHWDHVSGFPFFEPLFHDDTRIVVDGCRRSLEGLRRVFSQDYVDGTWPVRFEDLKAKINHSQKFRRSHLVVGDTVIESHALQHPQGGVGFKFIEKAGTFVFLTDNELREEGWKGTSFSHFVEFCRDADILVHDSQYTPEEMELRTGWGHSDYVMTTRLALEASVKRLVLFHHDPWRKDPDVDALVERAKEEIDKAGAEIAVEAAKERGTLVL